jgi:hypothetical protein
VTGAAAEAPRPELGWAILELMGHRRMAGWLTEVQVAGAMLLRIDVPASETLGDEARAATQLYASGAIYCITPTTEAIARQVAASTRPIAPSHRLGAGGAAGGPSDDDQEDLLAVGGQHMCQETDWCQMPEGHEGACYPAEPDDDED